MLPIVAQYSQTLSGRLSMRHMKIWVPGTSAFALVLLLASIAPSSALQISQDLIQASKLFEHHKVPAALDKVNHAIQLNPNLGTAYFLRAQIYLVLDKSELALLDIDKSLKLDKPTWRHYDVRARIMYERNDVPGAIAAATKGITNFPQEENLYRFRSKMYSLSKQYQKAQDDVTRAIAVQKADQESNYKLRGDSYMRFEKYNLAVADYTAAIDVVRKRDKDAGRLESFYSARALAYDKLGRKDLAAEDRKKVQEFVKDGWGAFLYEGKERK